MRALLSSVGTRGDVQPILAVAREVRALGHDVRLCVPPNFVAWAESFGFEAVAVGVEMRAPRTDAPPLTEAQLRQLRASMPDLIGDQFEKLGAAIDGCDVALGANAHQYAARSLAEKHGVPYVTALYAPVAIPSPEHAPPPLPGERWESGDAASNARRWDESARAWNARALERVDANRARIGLPPIDDVLRYNVTDAPWLATDALLAPAPSGPVFQTGAWIFDHAEPLPEALVSFLDAGDPPIYFGFGSMPAPPGVARAVLEAARAVGHRAIVSRGWAGLEIEATADAIAIDDVDQRALFPRTLAIVHHGGAGTTAAAARSGRPQVIAPMFGDQFYFASRVRALGIGSSVTGAITAESLASASREALTSSCLATAESVAGALGTEGAAIAARRLVSLVRA